MSLRLYGYFSILNGVVRKWSHVKFVILSLTPRRDVRIYYNILNVGYIFIEGGGGGWPGNIDVFFWGGGGGQNAKEKRLLYIQSPDFKSPHLFSSLHI